MPKFLTDWFHGNPITVKFLMAASAFCAFYFSGGKITYDQALNFIGTGLIAWGFLPRPGDKAPAKLGPNGLPMMCFLLALSLVSCTGSKHPVNWPKVLECGTSVSNIVGTVSRILLADGTPDMHTLTAAGESALNDLAREYGPGVVACVVKELVHDWTSPGAAQSPLRAAAAARGANFLAEKGLE